MAIQQSSLGELYGRMQSGDIIAFSGKKRFSRLVRLATGSIISHVGIVCEIENELHLVESISFKQKANRGGSLSGVSHSRIKQRIDSYDGSAWWLPLSAESRAKLNQEELCRFLQSADKKKYDMPQAIRAVLDVIEENPFFDLSTYSQEDLDTFFCSELATAALRAGGVIGNINPSEVTPVNLCSFNIFAKEYFQLKGRSKKLDVYNERNPEGFGLRPR